MSRSLFAWTLGLALLAPGTALAKRPATLLPGIKVTPAGVLRVIDLQLQGFAYLELQ